MNLGRNELISWVNATLQCEYSSVQMLADGVAYAQLLDAAHPGLINISKLNLSTRYPDDCLRNLRIVESVVKKLQIPQPTSFEKMSHGKFQDNIMFLQWIYNYVVKNATQNLESYEPFDRRIQILERQGKSLQQINPHLIPNEAYLDYEENVPQTGEYQSEHNLYVAQRKQELAYRVQQAKEDCIGVEGQIKTQMETNWKLMHNTERSIEDRNTLYSLLKQIEAVVKQSVGSSVGNEILGIINEAPEDLI